MKEIAGNEVRKRHKLGFIGTIFFSMERNNHRPHLLRGKVLFILSFIAVFLMGVSFARYHFLHQTVLGQEVVASVLIDLTNETRQAYGETPLVRNQKLENASAMKAEDMATYQYFAHNSPTGITPWFWIKKAGYDFLYAGENLAIDFTQSKDVEDAWMKSPTHKANLLNSKFQEIGISTKEGMIDGHNTIYVVQMFGTAKNTSQEDENTKIQASISAPVVPTPTKDSPNGEVAGAVAKTTSNENNNNFKSVNSSQSEEESQKTKATEITHTANENKDEKYITLADENNMMIVADMQALKNSTNTEASQIYNYGEQIKYSNFWQKLIYNFWFNLNYVYKVIVGLIMIALLLLLFAEFRKHHWLHMLYGAMTIALLLLLLYINQSLW